MAMRLADGTDDECADISYSKKLQDFENIEFDNESSHRQWTYQTCSEFGWYQTSASANQPFGNSFNVDFFMEMCGDIFGDAYVFVIFTD